ncbi:MAG: hypothetical protein GDA43_08555 [Hormoscilla sp. SP5CHS1]|nr:hypothetical protein [Hormoscilla sp. SP12CHS1]MBC6453252.1 hypothetical protein [Hormoscilla sp. SP5CHS1]MBC6473641.1 hypothetical protein [Hormoscilla sp. GM102CHS1]
MRSTILAAIPYLRPVIADSHSHVRQAAQTAIAQLQAEMAAGRDPIPG